MLESITLKPGQFTHPSALDVSAVTRDEKGFHVTCDGVTYDVPPAFIAKEIRALTPGQLEAFCNNGGYVTAKKVEEVFALQASVRGPGGGPFGALVGLVIGTAIGVPLVIFGAMTGNPIATAAGVYAPGAGAAIGAAAPGP